MVESMLSNHSGHHKNSIIYYRDAGKADSLLKAVANYDYFSHATKHIEYQLGG